MKFASFKYNMSVNLGDQIQSLAAEQYLPSLNTQLDRDSLHKVPITEKYTMIMNGWFCDFPENWPPSSAIDPIFFGFHMTWRNGAKDRFLQDDSIAYFKQHEPIGCRDKQTRDWLLEKGVDAFYSRCLTLTFPRRKQIPKNGKILLMDVDYVPVPRRLRKQGVKLSQMMLPIYDDELKRSMAKRLLEVYEQAALVITTKLHCAMPCLAMGVPVVFIGRPDDYRTSILENIGVTIYPYVPPKRKTLQLVKRLIYETFSLGFVSQDILNPPNHSTSKLRKRRSKRI